MILKIETYTEENEQKLIKFLMKNSYWFTEVKE